MTTTPMATQPGEPDDPHLRERYQRDAWEQREARRREAARAAAETPPSRTPSGPIRVIAGLVAVVLVGAVAIALAGPMLRQAETTDEALPAGVTSVQLENGVGDVRVRVAEPGETPSATVTSEWGLRRPTTDVGVSGSTASLRGRCPSGPSPVCSTEWLVVVPEGTDLDIGQGVGGVTVEGADGDVDVNAGVGDVQLTELESESVDVELGVGGLGVESVEPPRDVRAQVGVGDLTVRLPDTVRYAVETRGGASEVRNSLGSSPGADRSVVLETGVGSLTVDPS